MKKLLLSSLAGLILTTGSALAADLYRPAPAYKAPPPPAPAVSWTGCYIDGGVGDGCDYQIASSWVVGVFGDYDFMDLHSKNFADVSGIGSMEKESGAWYVGGRLGYLVTPSLLAYVDGGYTQTRFDRQELFDTLFSVPAVPIGAFIDAHTYSGWFIGGGTEYALNMPWIPIRGLFWRTEYRYAQYQAADLPILIDTGAPLGVAEHSQKTVQTVTSGLVWRFNFGGPLAARY